MCSKMNFRFCVNAKLWLSPAIVAAFVVAASPATLLLIVSDFGDTRRLLHVYYASDRLVHFTVTLLSLSCPVMQRKARSNNEGLNPPDSNLGRTHVCTLSCDFPLSS